MKSATQRDLSLSAAIAALSAAQKSNSGAPAYSRFINRPAGRVLAAVAYRLGLSPNQVTALSALCTFSGVLTIALVIPTLVSSIVVVVLLLLGYALDSADGQLSRLLGVGSVAGEWLDHTVDAFKMSSIHAATLICWARFYDVDALWLLVPLVFQIVSSVFFAQVLLADLLRRIAAAKTTTAADVPPQGTPYRLNWAYSLAVAPMDFGILALLFFALWAERLFIGVYLVLAAINALVLLVSCLRWYRSMKALAG